MDVLDAYNRIAAHKDLKLPQLKRGGYEIKPKPLSDPDQVWPTLVGYAPTQGWLQFQSAQVAFDDGLPEPESDWGLLIAAEAVTADGVSLALSLDGAGGWTLTRWHFSGDDDLLYDEVRQRAYDPKTGALFYRRWWCYDPDQGYVQVAACFIGFK